MVRTLVGYSVFAVIGLLLLKIVFWVVGAAFSLLVALFWLAAIGFGIYMLLRVISPATADRLRETIRGKNDAEPATDTD
jgi:hypothetical protein